eukprot:m.1318405 g.1318405  ORF g.1318405 m.1318405 type:complete len:472 (-) comp24841_c0_seq30:2847-4262(-)
MIQAHHDGHPQDISGIGSSMLEPTEGSSATDGSRRSTVRCSIPPPSCWCCRSRQLLWYSSVVTIGRVAITSIRCRAVAGVAGAASATLTVTAAVWSNIGGLLTATGVSIGRCAAVVVAVVIPAVANAISAIVTPKVAPIVAVGITAGITIGIVIGVSSCVPRVDGPVERGGCEVGRVAHHQLQQCRKAVLLALHCQQSVDLGTSDVARRLRCGAPPTAATDVNGVVVVVVIVGVVPRLHQAVHAQECVQPQVVLQLKIPDVDRAHHNTQTQAHRHIHEQGHTALQHRLDTPRHADVRMGMQHNACTTCSETHAWSHMPCMDTASFTQAMSRVFHSRDAQHALPPNGPCESRTTCTTSTACAHGIQVWNSWKIIRPTPPAHGTRDLDARCREALEDVVCALVVDAQLPDAHIAVGAAQPQAPHRPRHPQCVCRHRRRRPQQLLALLGCRRRQHASHCVQQRMLVVVVLTGRR